MYLQLKIPLTQKQTSETSLLTATAEMAVQLPRQQSALFLYLPSSHLPENLSDLLLVV